MLGLDVIGAGEGLSTQTIMLRIRKIDPDKLRRQVETSSKWGAFIPTAVTVADSAPDFVLRTALPIAKGQLEELGITADLALTKSPPPPSPPRETLTALGVGAALGFLLASVVGGLWYILAQGKRS